MNLDMTEIEIAKVFYGKSVIFIYKEKDNQKWYDIIRSE